MARDMTPVLKRCRALDLDPVYLGIDKKSKRNARTGKKMSEYGSQLREKQKAKFIYGVLEKPFRNYFARAQKLKYGTTGDNLMILLELRLDNVLFRLGFARTRKEARQIVDHKHVLEVTGARLVPAWLEANQESLSGTVKEIPSRAEIDVPVNDVLIVELYSK